MYSVMTKKSSFLVIFYKKVLIILNNIVMFGIITIASSLPLPDWGEVADSGAPQVVVSADTQKAEFC